VESIEYLLSSNCLPPKTVIFDTERDQTTPSLPLIKPPGPELEKPSESIYDVIAQMAEG
jgi:hypothetical protein